MSADEIRSMLSKFLENKIENLNGTQKQEAKETESEEIQSQATPTENQTADDSSNQLRLKND